MRLTDHDASFLYTETASGPMHGTSISVLDAEVSYERIYAHIERRLHLVPRYRERLVYVPLNLAHPKWVPDPDFKLDNHITSHAVTPGSSLEEAIDQTLPLAEPLLPRDRPLWKTIVVSGVPGKTLLVQMGHHAMIDGASGVDLSTVLLDFERDAPPPGKPNEPYAPPPLPSPLELITEATRENIERQMNFRPTQPGANPEHDRMLQTATQSMLRFVTQPAMTAPWNAGSVGPKRKLAWLEYDLDEIRDIRRGVGGTINDVALTVVTEAAARYLRDKGENTTAQHLRLMCPVSVRRESEAGTLGNRVSAIFPRLPAYSMPLLERLQLVRNTMESSKQNNEPQALELMQEVAPPNPPIAMLPTLMVGTAMDPTALAARFPTPPAPNLGIRPPLAGFNFTLTNVPGVQVPQYIAGAMLEKTIGTLMLGGTLGYGCVVTSYNRRLYINLTAEPRLMPDIDRMRDHIAACFAELASIAQDNALKQAS